MGIALSVLDQSPVGSGRTAADALAETLALARLADRLGYRRYWLAEHHNTDALAGAAPEVLIPLVAAATEHLRVGSGGVMLAHYSPLKVAETFRVLHTLFPGRIDLGIGRAPGSDRRTALALAQGQPLPIERFPEQLRDLAGFLYGTLPEDHPYYGVRVTPALPAVPPAAGQVGDQTARRRPAPAGPELWLLGSSGQSAAYAAALGYAFSFAHFINPEGGAGAAVLEGYRAAFRPSPLLAAPRASLAVRVLCAETDAAARRLSASFGLMRLRLEQGQWGPVPDVEEALAYPYSAVERARVQGALSSYVVGAPATVKARLAALAAAHGVDELVVVTICHDPAARRRSYELLADVFGLSRPRPDAPAPPAPAAAPAPAEPQRVVVP